MTACPCGSGDRFEACCGPILDGVPAPTALALMRSRYTAFTRADGDYLVRTHDPNTVGHLSAAALARSARAVTWTGLEIVTLEAGGDTDETGIVEFIASGTSRGVPFAQRERSRFRRIDSAWVYVDGKVR